METEKPPYLHGLSKPKKMLGYHLLLQSHLLVPQCHLHQHRDYLHGYQCTLKSHRHVWHIIVLASLCRSATSIQIFGLGYESETGKRQLYYLNSYTS